MHPRNAKKKKKERGAFPTLAMIFFLEQAARLFSSNHKLPNINHRQFDYRVPIQAAVLYTPMHT